MVYEINADSVRWRIVDGEAVLIHVETTIYYSLNATGTVVWQLLADGRGDLDGLTQGVAEKFDRKPAEVEDDVRHFLDQMQEEGLVRAS